MEPQAAFPPSCRPLFLLKGDIGWQFSTSWYDSLVFMKWLQQTLAKIPQWACKTPFLPYQKQLYSQWPDNELLFIPPLFSIFWALPLKTKPMYCVFSGSHVGRKLRLLFTLLNPTTKNLQCLRPCYCYSLWSKWLTTYNCWGCKYANMGQSINGRGQGQSNMISYCSKNLNSLIIETVQVF